MATTTATVWSRGFSESPSGKPLRGRTIVDLLDRIGRERVRPPGSPVGAPSGATADGPDAPLITRRELLARVLWTRAILDADNAAARLIIEYLDGKPGDGAAAPGAVPGAHFCADDLAQAEALLREEAGLEHPAVS